MKTCFGLSVSFVLIISSAAFSGPVTTSRHQPVFTLNNTISATQHSINYEHLPIKQHVAYNQALADDLTENVQLTMVTDNLDLGSTAHLWVQDKNGQWHFQDKNGKTMWFDNVTYCDEFTLQKPINLSEGDETGFKRSSSSTSVLNLSPYWFGGVSSGARMNWLVDKGVDQAVNPGDNPLNPGGTGNDPIVIPNHPSTPVVPAPGAVILTGMGLTFLSWVRSQRKI